MASRRRPTRRYNTRRGHDPERLVHATARASVRVREAQIDHLVAMARIAVDAGWLDPRDEVAVRRVVHAAARIAAGAHVRISDAFPRRAQWTTSAVTAAPAPQA